MSLAVINIAPILNLLPPWGWMIIVAVIGFILIFIIKIKSNSGKPFVLALGLSACVIALVFSHDIDPLLWLTGLDVILAIILFLTPYSD